MDALFLFLLIPYALILLLLFTYGANFYYLVYLSSKHRGRDPEPPALGDHPHVTVQLPLYNERFVAERLIEAVCRLEWPRDRFQVQVLDDSTDETHEIARAVVARKRARGINIQLLHREQRDGYKAGALGAGMASAKGDFLAVFDADFLPPEDFLMRTIPHFADPNVGFVQTRWGHLNAEYSFFTNLQSLAIDAHFMVEQYARQRAGFFMNFNGTAGVWRRRTIEEAGGWRADTLTEDLDLSYRAQMLGWRGQYLRDVVTPAELPVTVNAYRRQQYRWARGSFEVAIRMLPKIFRAELTKRVKLEAVLHLTGYGIHLLMSLLALIYPLVAWLSLDRPALISLFGVAAFLNLTALAPTVYFAFSQRELGGPWWKRLPSLLFLSVAGSGMMVNSLRAIGHAFLGSQSTFERTPKLDVRGRQKQGDSSAYPVQVSPVILWEALFLLYNLNTVRLALTSGHYVIGFYAGMFATGLLFLLGLTIREALVDILGASSAPSDQAAEALSPPEPFRSPNT